MRIYHTGRANSPTCSETAWAATYSSDYNLVQNFNVRKCVSSRLQHHLNPYFSDIRKEREEHRTKPRASEYGEGAPEQLVGVKGG